MAQTGGGDIPLRSLFTYDPARQKQARVRALKTEVGVGDGGAKDEPGRRRRCLRGAGFTDGGRQRRTIFPPPVEGVRGADRRIAIVRRAAA